MDERDHVILKERAAAFLARREVKQGDYIRFNDGVLRRVSHVWKDENNQPESVQTADARFGSSFYLGTGYMEFSGGLYSGIPAGTLTRTEELIDGACWFFHHDYVTAHNGVYGSIPCPVWNCSMEANQI